MQFSIWDYLKERARKATLAGVAEALEELEGEGSEMSHEAAADRLRARLGGQVVRQLPEPENAATGEPVAPVTVPAHSNGKAATPVIQNRTFAEGIESPPAARPAPVSARSQPPPKTPDPFEERLNGALPKPRPEQEPAPKQQAAPQERRGPSRNGHPTPDPEFTAAPPKPEAPERRKRGRPRKDGT